MTTSYRRNIPSITNIQAFLCVVRLRGITAASEELFVTQGAVSKQVLELEKHVGSSLFIRSTHGLMPTPAGQALFERLSPLIEKLADVFSDVETDRRSVLNISVPPSFGMEIISPHFSDFLNANAPLLVNLFTKQGEVDLDREGLDAAVIAGTNRSGNYLSECLFTPALFPYVSPELIKTDVELNLGALAQCRLIGLVGLPTAWLSYFASLGLPFDPARLTSNHSLLSTSAQAVMSGYGIALLPEYLAEQHVRSGLMVKVQADPYLDSNPYFLIVRKQIATSDAYLRFRDWMFKLLGNMGYIPPTGQ